MDRVIRALARSYSTEPTNENAHRLSNTVLRTVEGEQTHKVIIKTGHGGGWSTRVRIYGTHTPGLPEVWSGWTLFLREYGLAIKTLLLTFPPMIDAIESPEGLFPGHPAIFELGDELASLEAEYETLMPEVDPSIQHAAYDEFYGFFSLDRVIDDINPTRYLSRLRVVEVTGPFVVNEYDGSESVHTLQSFLHNATYL